ncbi:hypothetical protein LPJ57_005477, partial [Coemansia sp. RSA 486]
VEPGTTEDSAQPQSVPKTSSQTDSDADQDTKQGDAGAGTDDAVAEQPEISEEVEEEEDVLERVEEESANDQSVAEEQPVAEEQSAEPENIEDDKYNIDISDLAVGVTEREATEDQLEDLISFSESIAEPEPAAKEEASAETTPVADVANSVNMEDSQAELLASNLDDSMYQSAMSDSVMDEIHVLESSQEMSASEIHENDILDSIRSIDSTDRKYVITPTAFVTDENAEEIDSRPQSAANNASASEGAAAVAEVQASAQQVKAAADAGSAELNTQKPESIAEEATAPSAQTIAGSVGQSMAESYVHVDKDSDGLEKSNGSIVPDMANREESEKVERAVGNAMDSAKEGTKEAANKASETANSAGKKASKAASDAKDSAQDAADDLSKKANKAASSAKDAAESAANDVSKKARDAADSANDAANDAASKARDVLDNASKSVRDAASNVNDKAHSAMNKARESGEKLAKKAREEAEEAEKAVKKQAKETPPTTLRALGIVAAALAVVSGYYFRLPGRENQRLGFSSGVASAVIGLGTLATAFIKRNA